jgi:hypothetical protein
VSPSSIGDEAVLLFSTGIRDVLTNLVIGTDVGSGVVIAPDDIHWRRWVEDSPACSPPVAVAGRDIALNIASIRSIIVDMFDISHKNMFKLNLIVQMIENADIKLDLSSVRQSYKKKRRKIICSGFTYLTKKHFRTYIMRANL